MVSGSPALLSAEVLGSAQHLNWDLNGDGKTEVSCPGDQPTLRFRPSCARRRRARRGPRRQRVRPGGRAAGARRPPVLSQTFEVAPPIPARSNRIKDAVIKVVAGQPPPYMCGLARDLVPAMTEIREDRNAAEGRPASAARCRRGTLTLRGASRRSAQHRRHPAGRARHR